jgi:GTPase SAR1 family protein
MFYEKEDQSNEKTHKILFTGLDGAGKTSIILTLQREFSKIAVIEPTRGAQRTNFKLMGREITEWDLGGQKSYLISYLKNPSKYFDETEIAIYVIDILDHSRAIESVSYLYDVVEKFRELKINPPLNVFFHKYDPKFIDTTESEVQSQVAKLQKEIQETISYSRVQFFSTSIHNPYSIMNAMSTILLELFPRSELLQKTIEEYANKLSCEGLIIIDKNSIILGSSFRDSESKKILSSTIAYFLTLNDVFEEMEVDQPEDQIVVRKLGKYFLFKPIVIKNTTMPYYMLVLKEHNPFDIYFINKEFAAFVNMFSDIIQS